MIVFLIYKNAALLSVASKQQILCTSVRQLLSISEYNRDQTSDIYYLSIAALKRLNKACSSGTDTMDEESSNEEVEQITEVEMEEEQSIMNIFYILKNTAFIEVENEKDGCAF